ncbi:MAG TPA: hypothetical protein VG388_14735 [Solirubrobacteraceae bacterium]|jgi:hypothetical protein|nr:hypothetical protein [Solirubrobacteraceae bacterium]
MTESRDESQQEGDVTPTPPEEWSQDREDVMYPASDPDSLEEIPPGIGGYDDRDPGKEMPRVPSSPQTQDK